MGNVLNKFGCSKHLEFPNGVVVNDRQEIFISDNRAHCVKVFNYEGQYLRQIGGEGKAKLTFHIHSNDSYKLQDDTVLLKKQALHYVCWRISGITHKDGRLMKCSDCCNAL